MAFNLTVSVLYLFENFPLLKFSVMSDCHSAFRISSEHCSISADLRTLHIMTQAELVQPLLKLTSHTFSPLFRPRPLTLRVGAPRSTSDAQNPETSQIIPRCSNCWHPRFASSWMCRATTCVNLSNRSVNHAHAFDVDSR